MRAKAVWHLKKRGKEHAREHATRELVHLLSGFLYEID